MIIIRKDTTLQLKLRKLLFLVSSTFTGAVTDCLITQTHAIGFYLFTYLDFTYYRVKRRSRLENVRATKYRGACNYFFDRNIV